MICDCGHDSDAYTVHLTARGRRSVCRACQRPRMRSCHNPFASLKLDHAHDESGRPIEVTSLRQLYEAERKYHFRSLVANEREADFDKPPQTPPTSAFEAMSREGKWLFPEVAENMLRDMQEAGELA